MTCRWLACLVMTMSCGQDPEPDKPFVMPEELFVNGQKIPLRKGDVMYLPTADVSVHQMLELAKVGPADTVYDLGSGDGRIPIAAARDFGAHGVGIEIDPVLVREAQANAKKAGVADKVEFRVGNMFEVDLRPATVVTLYLFEHLNLKLRPKLLSELRPGSRVVSHVFGMGDWKPDLEKKMPTGYPVYVWNIGEHPPK